MLSPAPQALFNPRLDNHEVQDLAISVAEVRAQSLVVTEDSLIVDLSAQYNELNPSEQVNLGSTNRGNDKVRIPEKFATFLLAAIIEID